jgi:CheY-like chemotaxis protein
MADLLVVEDSPDIAELLCALLDQRGNTVRLARNGIEGLQALDRRLPQLVISDVDMPVLDGPAMIYRMFVADLGRENIPVVLMSGTERLPEVAATLGTRYFIAKPFDLPDLLHLIDRALVEAVPPRPRLGRNPE